MKKTNEITINGKTLQQILEIHKVWLEKKGGERADLSFADLSCADLRGANLCDTDLRGTDLCGADLRGANLSYADLCDADLLYTDLYDADLSCVDLSGADLRGADLSWVNLCDTDLRYVDLRYADLCCADLCGADLRGANIDFSQLNLSCKGLNFKIDERQAKQLMYHIINLMQYSNLDVNKVIKKHMYKWLEDSHIVKEHDMPILKKP